MSCEHCGKMKITTMSGTTSLLSWRRSTTGTYKDDYIYEWCEASQIMDRRISALLDELKATALHCPAVGNAPTVFVITIHPGFCDFDG